MGRTITDIDKIDVHDTTRHGCFNNDYTTRKKLIYSRHEEWNGDGGACKESSLLFFSLGNEALSIRTGLLLRHICNRNEGGFYLRRFLPVGRRRGSTDDHGRRWIKGAIFDTFFVVFILFLFLGCSLFLQVTFFLLGPSSLPCSFLLNDCV